MLRRDSVVVGPWSPTATLMLGTGVAQALTLLVLPFLTRLYAPSALGAFACFAATVMIVGLVVCGRYEVAIPLPEDDRTAANLTWLAISLGLSVSLFAGGVGMALALTRPNLPAWWFAIPTSLALTSVYQPWSYWFTRKGEFRAIAASRIAQSLLATSVPLVWVWRAEPSAVALIAGALLGQLAATLTLAAFAASAPLPRVLDAGKSLVTAARRYRDFPRFTTGASLLGLATDQLPLILVPWWFGLVVAGELSLSTRLLQAALVLIATTSAQAFLPRAARATTQGDLGSLCLDRYRRLLRSLVVPALGMGLVAPWLLAFGFGEPWRPAGELLRVQLLWFLATLGSTALGHAFTVQERQRAALLWHGAGMLLFVATFAALAATRAPALTVGAAASSVALVRLLATDWIVARSGAARGAVLETFARELARGLVILLGPALVAHFAPGALAFFVTAAVVCGHAAAGLRPALAERRA